MDGVNLAMTATCLGMEYIWFVHVRGRSPIVSATERVLSNMLRALFFVRPAWAVLATLPIRWQFSQAARR